MDTYMKQCAGAGAHAVPRGATTKGRIGAADELPVARQSPAAGVQRHRHRSPAEDLRVPLRAASDAITRAITLLESPGRRRDADRSGRL